MRPLLFFVCLFLLYGTNAFETLFARSLARLVHKTISSHRELAIERRPPTVEEGLIAKLRNDLSSIDNSQFTRSYGRNEFDEGIGQVTNAVILTGVRNRGQNVSDFCGRLGANQLRRVHPQRRDSIMFIPAQPIVGLVANMTLSVPRAWFREPRRRNHRKEFKVFVCYEGETKLLLLPLTVYQSDLSVTKDYYIYKQHHKFNENMSIREVALILDGQWNNAFLIPKHLKATVVLPTHDVKPRVIYTKQCDPRLGNFQDCCLWHFTSEITFGPANEKKTIGFHRCVGQPPDENMHLPMFGKNISHVLKRGGMSRRFVFPPRKVCRESKFKPVKLTSEVNGDIHVKRLNHLDAIECAVFY